MPPTCSSMPPPNEKMIAREPINPNGSIGGYTSREVQDDRKNRQEKSRDVRIPRARSHPRLPQAQAQALASYQTRSNRMVKREKEEIAKQMTLIHFEKTAKDNMDVSMHAFFPTARGLPPPPVDAGSAQNNQKRTSQTRSRPPLIIGAAMDDPPGEHERGDRERRRISRAPPHPDDRHGIRGIIESKSPLNLHREDRERERRSQDRNQSFDQIPGSSDSIRSKGSDSGSKGRRSTSLPRHIPHPRDVPNQRDPDRMRRVRSSSISKGPLVASNRANDTNRTSRTEGSGGSLSSPRQAVESASRQRLDSDVKRGSRSQRILHNEQHDQRHEERQLVPVHKSFRKPSSDDRRTRSSLGNVARSHRSLGTEEPHRRQIEDRPRRAASEAELLDRPRRPTSQSDRQDRNRARGLGDGDGDRDRLRNPNHRGSLGGNSRSERILKPRRKISGSSSLASRDTRNKAVRKHRLPVDNLDDSQASSNPFADAMKAILLDGNVTGFNTEKELEQRIADLVWGKIQNSSMTPMSNNETRAVTDGTKNVGPPQNTATIVLTDVQGSTSLWEANPQAMQEALDIHDKILRRFCAFHNGYEIDTEGDAFFLAFHTPMDAFGFALDTQSALFDTEWSKDLMKIPAAAPEGCFRGLRVRMGIHQGAVTSCKNEVTGRTEYVGEAMSIAKCVEGMTHGGQILTTFDTWNEASYKAEADLGSPQVVDLGCHLLKPKGHDESIARRIIQLVPASLSFDYFAARRSTDGDVEANCNVSNGRQFDEPITEEQLSASFHDAPHQNNEVTIAFVYFSEIENQYEDPKPIVASLIRLIGDLLVGTPGYHSQSNMLAFPNVNEAIKFGLTLMNELQETRLTDDYADLSTMIKFGCVHDTFLTMGPHKTTGRADYFGKVVNRAARITAKSELGTVNFGVLADDSIAKLPVLDPSIICKLKGVKQLKGVQEDMALYECSVDKHCSPLGLRS